jgi:4-hydroxymandelate oxidase
MDWNELRSKARENFHGICRMCRSCNGAACAGEVPGMGGAGSGASSQRNAEALAALKFNMRTVHGVHEPKLDINLLGMHLALPVIGAPIGGMNLNMKGFISEADYAAAVVSGCKKAGILCMTGDGVHPVVLEAGFEAIKAEGGQGIPIIKPRATDRIIALAEKAAEAGAPAFGVDIDSACSINMTNAGQPVGPKSAKELSYIKKHTSLPFIVKGIMTPDEAETCCYAGVDAIVVSNHGGRALDHLPGTAEVLPVIAEAVKGKMVILADGGIQHGGDVLKMLALGADAVLAGRYIMQAAIGGGAEGVAMAINRMGTELRAAMIMTGTAEAASVSSEILW